MSAARPVFTINAVGFIRARSLAVTMPRVASTRRICNERTSHSSKNAFVEDATPWPSARARSRAASRAQTRTDMPNAFA